MFKRQCSTQSAHYRAKLPTRENIFFMGDLVPCPWESEFSPKEELTDFWLTETKFIKSEPTMDDPFADFQQQEPKKSNRKNRPSPLKLDSSLGSSFESFSSNETSPNFSDQEVPESSFK